MKRTFGALMGYSSGKNNSSLNTPPSNGELSGPVVVRQVYGGVLDVGRGCLVLQVQQNQLQELRDASYFKLS